MLTTRLRVKKTSLTAAGTACVVSGVGAGVGASIMMGAGAGPSRRSGAGAGVSTDIGVGAGVSMMIGAGAGATSKVDSGMSGAGAGASSGGGTAQPVLRNLQQSRGAMQPGTPDPPVQHFP